MNHAKAKVRRRATEVAAIGLMILGAFALGFYSAEQHATQAIVPPWPVPLPGSEPSPTPTMSPTPDTEPRRSSRVLYWASCEPVRQVSAKQVGETCRG